MLHPLNLLLCSSQLYHYLIQLLLFVAMLFSSIQALEQRFVTHPQPLMGTGIPHNPQKYVYRPATLRCLPDYHRLGNVGAF